MSSGGKTESLSPDSAAVPTAKDDLAARADTPRVFGEHSKADLAQADTDLPAVADGTVEVSVTDRSSRELLQTGVHLDHFTVIEEIGRGGMGVVLAAYDPKLDRKVAIKVLHPRVTGDKSIREGQQRLLREARALAKLSHPNVVTVHEVGVHGESIFVAMEYVHGVTVSEWLEVEKRSQAEILGVFFQAGQGLAAAHDAGLVHRDFKPDNIIVGDDGRIRVMDFGLVSMDAEHVDSQISEDTPVPVSPDLTRMGSIMGTPRYMAPEQHRGGVATKAADQYSFCIALYEALYGERPFDEERHRVMVAAKEAGRVRDAPSGVSVPGWLRVILLRGLSADVRDRYPSMRALLAALRFDPAARNRRWMALPVLLAGIGLGAAVMSAGASPGESMDGRCGSAVQLSESLWSDADRAKIEKAFANSGVSYAVDTAERVGRLLRDRASAWSAMRKAACEATWVRGEQGEALLDMRMQCLDRRRSEQQALVTLFSAPEVDATIVGRAVQAAQSLPDLALCSGALGLGYPPPSTSKIAPVEDIRNTVDEVRALLLAGRYRIASSRGQAAVDAARKLDYPPVLGEALYALAEAFRETGDFGSAETTFRETISVATQARNDRLIALAAAKWIWVVGYAEDRAQEAMATVPLAESAAHRVQDDIEVQSTLLYALGVVEYAKGNYEAAGDYARRRLSLLEGTLSATDPRVAKALNNLGLALVQQQKYESGIEHLNRAGDIYRLALGENHPAGAVVLNNLAMAYADLGKDSDAHGAYERALSLLSRAHGPEHPDVAAVHFNLGNLLVRQLKLKEAEWHYRRALALNEKALGTSHSRTGDVLAALGFVLHRQGKNSAAIAFYDRALETYYSSVGEEHEDVGSALIGLGKAFLARSEVAKAITRFERAIAILETKKSPFLPEAQFFLAKALWESPKDRLRAHALASRARDGFAAARDKPGERYVKDVDQWLEERGLAPRNADVAPDD